MKKVSILIVSRNAKKDLPRLFKSINRLTYPKKFLEVVYVDDGSTDGSIEVAKKFGAKVYRFEKRQGRARVRNFALKKAKHPIIAWIDSDCEIKDKDWIQNMLKHLKGKVIGVAGNQLKPPRGLSRVAWYLPGMAVVVDREKFASWAPTTSSMFVKKLLLKAKFDENLITAEDLEICWRLARKGYKFKQVPNAEIIHYFRTTFSKFADQQYERGIFGGHLLAKYGKSFISKVMVNSFFLLVALLLALVFFPQLIWLVLIFPLVFYSGLGYFELFPSVVWKYLKKEKSFSGFVDLIVLQYIRTFALFAGLVAFHLKRMKI